MTMVKIMTKMSIEHLWSAHLNQMTFLQNTDLVAFHHSVQPVLNLKPDWGLLVIPKQTVCNCDDHSLNNIKTRQIKSCPNQPVCNCQH